MTSILIADDHEIVIKGIKDLLRSEFDSIHLGEAKSRDEIQAALLERQWDLIMLDIVIDDMNVIDMLATIRERQPTTPILILTAVSETEYAVRTLAAGANGYITKHCGSQELMLAVQRVLAGETYLSREAAAAMASHLQGNQLSKPHLLLSQRELEVFCLIAKGKTVKEIAFDLNVSAKTISTYITRIREKTKLENYVDIARYALLNRLVE